MGSLEDEQQSLLSLHVYKDKPKRVPPAYEFVTFPIPVNIAMKRKLNNEISWNWIR